MAMALNANGRIQAIFGHPSKNILPSRPEPEFALMEVESERFYSSFGEFGYGYYGPFKALSSLKRKLGVGTGFISTPASDDPEKSLMIHPATLDCAIQSILLAFCFPGDSRLRSIQLPTSIDRIRVNPSLCISQAGRGVSLPFNSSVSGDHAAEIDGDVDVYAEDGLHAMIQLEGMHTKPLSAAIESSDLLIFSEAVWDFDSPKSIAVMPDGEKVEENYDLAFVLERVAYFYLRNLDNTVPCEEREKTEWHYQRFFAYIDHVLERVENGKHPFAKKEWIHDTHDQILALIKKCVHVHTYYTNADLHISRYPKSIDLRLMAAIGENMTRVVREESNLLEHLMQDNMLNDFYVEALGMSEYLDKLTRMCSQIGHRYPHMNVLEIGGKTSSTIEEES
jgi:hybrid polyketide synthase/nonribosomal peptide synthetase ACE1